MRFSYENVDNYGGNGGSGFFSLANDGDVARVRFMYNKLEDIEGVAVHEIEVNGKKRYVNCLREYGHPVDDCPLCKKGLYVQAKLFIPVFDVETEQVKVWERGKKFFGRMAAICSRYASKDNLVNHTFEVERHGKKGDTQTTYEMFDVGTDDVELENLPELPTIVGGLVLDKNKDELQYFVDYNEFPDSSSDRPAKRTASNDMPIRRRTPSISNEDTF